jgi:RHS repeat-associated protein
MRLLIIFFLLLASLAEAGFPRSSGLLATNTLNSYLPTTLNFSYDANGNLTNDGVRAFYYDAENQLTNITVAGAWRTEFVYDGLHRRRIRKEYTWTGSAWSLTNETRYVYDSLLVLQERDGNNIPVLTYTRGLDLSGTLQGAGGISGLLALSDQRASASNPTNYYYHADGNGNIVALLNYQNEVVARYLYDPFGNPLLKSGPMADFNRVGFSSKERHHSGLILYEFRVYDPNLQRWLTQDPIGEAGGINLYRFLLNNPVDGVDAFGLRKLREDEYGGLYPNNFIGPLPDGADRMPDFGPPYAPQWLLDFIDFIDKPIPEGMYTGSPPMLRPGLRPCPPVAKRTPAQNREARNQFKNNKDAAREDWEKRTGQKWPTDENGNPWPAEHTPPLKEGGDPMKITPRDPGAPDPHNIRGPDGLTDYQRWGAEGTPAREANRKSK